MGGEVSIPGLDKAPTNHAELVAWVREIAALTKPAEVYWCDGSDEEFKVLTDRLVEAGTLQRLNPDKRPNSFYAASDPRDVARVESRTSSAPKRRSTPARPTTGPPRPRCAIA